VHDPLDDIVTEELETLRARGLYRERRPAVAARRGPRLTLADGRTLLSFCGNDYLDLAQHPRVVAAAADALARFGAGAGASRLITGELAIHRDLEDALTAFTGRGSATVFPTGFQANLGAVGALAGPGDLVLSDARNHASLVDACRAARATVRVYDHADPDAAAAILRREGRDRRRRVIVTDAVFSMTGAIAPVPALLDVAARHDAVLVVDEAHATGVLGATGRGVAEHFGLAPAAIPVTIVTFGKALGSQGGAVVGAPRLADLLRNRARSYVYTTALAPACAAAVHAALGIVAAEPDRVATLARRAAALRAAARAAGWHVAEGLTPIVPAVCGAPARALAAAAALEARGLLAVAVRPPTVPEGEAGLRLTVGVGHTDADVAALGAALAAARATGQNAGAIDPEVPVAARAGPAPTTARRDS
jgi:8-amino-7-oxononanoate synthase